MSALPLLGVSHEGVSNSRRSKRANAFITPREYNITMNEGKKFRVYPTKEQIKTLSQWIGHQSFINNSEVGEDRYFRKFKNKSLSLIGEDIPCDQKYS